MASWEVETNVQNSVLEAEDFAPDDKRFAGCRSSVAGVAGSAAFGCHVRRLVDQEIVSGAH
jgi:hypothetical protein